MVRFGFLGVGAIYEDTFLSLPHYPQEDSKLRATELTTRVGGNIPNTFQVLSQARGPDDRLIFLSAFAEKSVSKRLTDPLESKGIEIAGVWRDECRENPRSWILKSQETGSRTIVNYNGVRELSKEELVNTVSSLPNLHEIGWVHFEGRIPDVLLAAIPELKAILQPETIISIEFEKPDRVGLNDLIPLAQIAIFSRTYFKHWVQRQEQVTDETILLRRFFKELQERNPQTTAIITMGEEGACLGTRHRTEGYIPFATEKVQVVDATGAGDTFLAGFVWAYGVKKVSSIHSVELAVKLATIKVAQEGFEGIWQELVEL